MKKQKFMVEYSFKNTPVNVLWNAISTSFGLSEWFADDVTSNGDAFTFWWSDQPSLAYMIKKKVGDKVRFQWEDDADTDCYFELQIMRTELSSDVSLVVTDFASADEKDDSVLLWNQEVERLQRRVGA